MKKIKIIVKEMQTKEGKKFLSYKAVKIDGKLIDCRFTKEVKNLPTETCFINVEASNINIEKNCVFPKLWVKKIESIDPTTRVELSEDDLPF